MTPRSKSLSKLLKHTKPFPTHRSAKYMINTGMKAWLNKRAKVDNNAMIRLTCSAASLGAEGTLDISMASDTAPIWKFALPFP
jgi:hypothetical protein